MCSNYWILSESIVNSVNITDRNWFNKIIDDNNCILDSNDQVAIDKIRKIYFNNTENRSVDEYDLKFTNSENQFQMTNEIDIT